ncbi:unnamed protein product [Periconia digitata]|uniref:Uncharacterized protein n=1 Tax=Periconia digitata TaxID=1303443 RepID=A0A9W4XGE9_9PLEO|nr:unnamed protein product [Periconia digitata]
MASVPTTSIASASPSASANAACATQNFSEFPTADSGCAVGSRQGIPSSYKDTLQKCCKSAPVESWADDCAAYCLAVDQTVADLVKCFQDDKVNPSEIFCSGNNTATATGKPSSSSGSGSSSGRPGETGGSQGDAQQGQNMASVQGVSKAGLGVVAMVFTSALFGAML